MDKWELGQDFLGQGGGELVTVFETYHFMALQLFMSSWQPMLNKLQ